MTIKIKQGDVLNATENIIGHQVNCVGIMVAGLAKQVRNKYPAVYNAYKSYLKQHGRHYVYDLLGKNLIVSPEGIPVNKLNTIPDRLIANLFGQVGVSRRVKQTDEDALEAALVDLAAFAKTHNLSVALPYGMACGLGGADWGVVLPIIERVFEDQTVTLYRYNG